MSYISSESLSYKQIEEIAQKGEQNSYQSMN